MWKMGEEKIWNWGMKDLPDFWMLFYPETQFSNFVGQD
jgi:hypothetical protein